MFLKTTRSGNYEYLQVVESVRVDGKVTHRVRLNLGRKDAIVNSPEWQSVASKLAVLAGLEAPKPKRTSILDGIELSEGVVLNWGYEIYRKLWKTLLLDRELNELQSQSKLSFSVEDAVLLMTLHHLLSPGSKLNAYERQDRYASLPPVELHHLYRALDFLCEHKEVIEERLFERNYSLLNSEIDVVFYDVTTFSFESVKADGLRDFGFSKDSKFGEVQVVLGMFIDAEGCPIGYELFSGNTFDGKTLVPALDVLKKRFGIRRVIIVADRGINSKLNLQALSDAGYGYIVATRLRSMPKAIQDEARSPEGYSVLSVDTETGEVKVRTKQMRHTNVIRESNKVVGSLEELMVITHSTKRAAKDAADRQRLLDKAAKMMEHPGSISGQLKRGGRRFIKSEGETDIQYSIDQDAILRDAAWDGYYAIQTSELEMTTDKVLEAYGTLWKIEESFRVMKSTLEVRPIYHWTEDRIRGHFVVCFLAFLMERHLELKLQRNQIDASPDKIREALNGMTVTKLNLNGSPIFVKTKNSTLAGQITRAMKLKQPATVTTQDVWEQRRFM